MENLKNSFQVFAFIALCLFAVTPLSAQGWDRLLPDTLSPANMVELPNGDFITYKNTLSDSSTTWLRLDKTGRIKRTVRASYFNGGKDYFGIVSRLAYADGFVWATFYDGRYGVLQLDTLNFSVQYRRTFDGVELSSIIRLPTGNLLLIGHNWQYSPFPPNYPGGFNMTSLNPTTHTVNWSKTYNDYFYNELLNPVAIVKNKLYIVGNSGQ